MTNKQYPYWLKGAGWGLLAAVAGLAASPMLVNDLSLTKSILIGLEHSLIYAAILIFLGIIIGLVYGWIKNKDK